MISPLQIPVEFLGVSAAVSGMSSAEQATYLTGLAAPTTIANLDGRGLSISWSITRTRSSKTDAGEVTIKNLSTAFRKELYATWQQFNATSTGFKCGVHIGWGGLVNLVMFGDVWEMVPEQRVGEDVLTTLRFGEGQRPVKEATSDTPTQYTYQAGNVLGLWLTIQAMFGQLGLAVDQAMLPLFTAAVTRTALSPSGTWSLDGELVDDINDTLDTFGLEWKVYQGSVIFMDRGVTAVSQDSLAVLLTASTGLLEWQPADDGAIVCKALAQPAMRPGIQFTVVDAFGVPVGSPGYRVEAVQFTGTTDGESIMTVTGRRSIPV